MDSDKGLRNQNMDFLFGLDMLKRHRCKIDLERSALVFGLPDGQSMEAPFLHEKDLDKNKELCRELWMERKSDGVKSDRAKD